LTNSDPDVTILSPIGTPRVSDVPVGVGGTVVVVAGQLHAMIDVVTAGGQNASLVVLPRGSIDADGDGATRGRAELLVFTRLARDGGVGSNVGDNGTLGELAVVGLTATSSVGVVGIAVNTASRLDVLVGTSGETTTTALILTSSVAVNNLFHGELSQSTSLDGKVRLDGLSGRESPAGTALALVVDGGDDAS